MDSVSFKTGNLSAKLVPSGVLKGSMSVSEYCHDYDGSYTATPTNEEQVFETKDKRMTDNFTVQPIPFDLSSVLDSLINRNITEISNDRVTSIGKSAFRYCSSLKTVDFPLVTSIGADAFSYCSSLTTANTPLVRGIDTYAFSYCSNLKTADFPLVMSISDYAFNRCISLKTVNFPSATGIRENSFYSCTKLTTANLPLVISISSNAFRSCSKLTTLFLRRSDAICTLSNVNAFTSTPIASGTGYIYVPSALVESYKAATNWSTYANKIRAIEDYPEITGG